MEDDNENPDTYLLLLAALAFSLPPEDARASKDASRFEIIGMSLGMSLAEAMQILRAHSPALLVRETQGDIASIRGSRVGGLKYPLGVSDAQRAKVGVGAGSYGNEIISVLGFAPPNESTVAVVSRVLTFKEIPYKDLRALLVEKYGKPSFEAAPMLSGGARNPYYTLSWSRGPDNAPLKNRQSVDQCSRVDGRQLNMTRIVGDIAYHSNAIASPYQKCGFTFVLNVTPSGGTGLVSGYQALLYDGNAVRRKNQATVDYSIAEAKKLEAQRLQRARETERPQL